MSNSQVVKFMDGVVGSHHDGTLPLAMEIREERGKWPPHTNVITYVLRSLDDEVIYKAPALAVTTRAMREKTPVEVGVEGKK